MSHPSQTSSTKKWKDAPTRSVDVAGTKFVYRQLGPAAGVPVIMLNHWGAVLDSASLPKWRPDSSLERDLRATAREATPVSVCGRAHGQYLKVAEFHGPWTPSSRNA
jgi:hypothetical protein